MLIFKLLSHCFRMGFFPFIGGGSSNGHEIKKSLRFRGAQYLNRVMPTGSVDTNTKIKTYSIWCKRSTLGAIQDLLSLALDSANYGELWFDASDHLNFQAANSGSTQSQKISNAVYRDPGGWYHIVLSVNTTLATALDRVKLYVNGVLVTSYGTNTHAQAQNGTFGLSLLSPLSGAWTGGIGYHAPASRPWFGGYIAESICVDGQELDPSYFGKIDPATGAWVHKKYSGSYGTSGFYLPFDDGTSTTTLGADRSGNGNNWTLNSFSLTAGVTYDWMDDTPSNNFPTFNPTDNVFVTNALSDGNLGSTTPVGANYGPSVGSIGISSGSYYWELTSTSGDSSGSSCRFGITRVRGVNDYLGSQAGDVAWQGNGNKYLSGGSAVSYGATFGTVGDVVGVAFNASAGTVEYFKNGVSQGVAATGLTGTYFPAFGDATSIGGGYKWSVNFGQRPFAYPLPSGSLPHCTKNLPVPAIKNGKKFFNVLTWVGTGIARALTGLGFQPDMVWIKDRTSGSQSHRIIDSVRGATKEIYTNATNAQATDAQSLTSFDSDGFSLGTAVGVNANTNNDIGWSWVKSILSGVDIVSFTGNATNRTIAHSLGVPPAMIIVKALTTAGFGWPVYHQANTVDPETDYLNIQSTAATADLNTLWNDTKPTSSVFSVGTNGGVNNSGDAMIAYLFAEVPGFSKFGSYTGNGSADGAFVWLGFKARWLMIKRTDTTGEWLIYDTLRNPFNNTNLALQAQAISAEVTASVLDILSNGFKLRDTNASYNASGGSYVFAAFAECPFKYANAR